MLSVFSLRVSIRGMVVSLFLAWFGLAFGSFVNALVWRVKTGKSMNGRSQCPNCKHNLSALDLIPVLSWLMLRGKCRYCKKPISWQYPAVELAGALVFVASYHFWPVELVSRGDWLLFITWLVSSVGLLALAVYDLRWMLLPSKILYPTAAIAISGRLIYLAAYESDKAQAALELLLSVAIASGIFFILYIVSSGRWIGFGDVRLGLITGALLADPGKSFLMIFLASMLGTLFVLPSLLTKKKNLQAKIPYGPFLIIGAFISLLFGQNLVDWYRDFLI